LISRIAPVCSTTKIRRSPGGDTSPTGESRPDATGVSTMRVPETGVQFAAGASIEGPASSSIAASTSTLPSRPRVERQRRRCWTSHRRTRRAGSTGRGRGGWRMAATIRRGAIASTLTR
jgi:hypothetical protein